MNAIYLELYPYCVIFCGVWDWQAVRTEAGVGQCLEEMCLDSPDSHLQDPKATAASFTG